MTKNQRVKAFTKLGEWMQNPDQETRNIISTLFHKNAWYTTENVHKQFKAIGNNLTQDKLQDWLHTFPDTNSSKSVGLILAGNLPLVGFSDILAVLITGFNVQIKASSEDAGLTALVLSQLIQIEPSFKAKISFVDKLVDFDLIIATGSNNSSRYFEYYFSKQPHIIRKNRNSIAVISGNEEDEQLHNLGYDIFDYFGLGCRSVSKIFIPKGYQISRFFERIESFSSIKDHHKYNNNYDYNKSIYLINKDRHYDNGFLLLKEDTQIASPMAVLFYQEYETIQEVEQYINTRKEEIQCIVATDSLSVDVPQFTLGASQYPALDDYADGINVLEFLRQH